MVNDPVDPLVEMFALGQVNGHLSSSSEEDLEEDLEWIARYCSNSFDIGRVVVCRTGAMPINHVSPRRFCSPRCPNKWYQSRWLIGLVLRSIYEKHRKSSRQGGSSGESRGVVRRCDGRILKCGEGARRVVLDVETHT
ncbi:hypothetical protein PIB30_074189 [Stylosanthes scabra]|uniref:Uncharacterized protein n=1 Tax=Stylosanthes scabra TaxID=79078 RepID=A0ABU6VQJ7_9FABA|nr:hypothetical protein [Stylosanthes scabra]